MTASAQVIAPIHATYYPRLCELSDPEGRERVYLEAHSVAVALAWPVTLSLAAYAPTVLRLWTRDGSIEAAAGLPLSILSLAASVNAPLQVVLGLAYAMQRAPDVARMQTLGAIGFAIACPALVWRWGIGGAALATLGFNLTLAAIFVTRTHRALRGSGTTRRWLRTILPIAMPVAAIATVGAGLSWTTPSLAARAVIAGLGSVAAALAGVGMLRRLRAAQASR
jgi:O-antigen/teichoic acid export membrane protein